MTISLSFLAPDLIKGAIDGRLPDGIGITRLADLPAEWSRQYQLLGLPAHNTTFEPHLCYQRSQRDFAGQRQSRQKRPFKSNEPLAETEHTPVTPPIRSYSSKTGKSPFVWDYVVDPAGLELRTKSL
jgi:hypothetical protein